MYDFSKMDPATIAKLAKDALDTVRLLHEGQDSITLMQRAGELPQTTHPTSQKIH